MPAIPALGKQRQEDLEFEDSLVKVIETLSKKPNISTRGGGVAQAVERLPNKHETLNSNSNTAQNK
jgi:hypothetical protein